MGIRIWDPGCSDPELAIAMALLVWESRILRLSAGTLKLCGLLYPTALPGAGTLTCLHPAARAEQQVAQEERYRLLPHGGAELSLCHSNVIFVSSMNFPSIKNE